MIRHFSIFLIGLSPAINERVGGDHPYIVVSPSRVGHRVTAIVVTPVAAGNQTCPAHVTYRFRSGPKRVILSGVHAISGIHLIGGLKGVDTSRRDLMLRALTRVFTKWTVICSVGGDFS